MNKIFLYLARRDKSAVKILSIFQGNSTPATRISNIKDLNLPKVLETKIGTTVYQNRFLWEVWIESAENSAQLRKNLITRGYNDLPIAGRPLFAIRAEDDIGDITPDLKKIPIKNKTMLQKKTNY